MTMTTIEIVATILIAITVVAGLLLVYWITLVAQFATLASDEGKVPTQRRFEQLWIQSYLPNTASVLQIAGSLPTMINVQAKLVDSAQKEKHVLLNSNMDVIDELVFEKDKSNLQTKVIHGVVADTGRPVSFLSRGYATTDYYGEVREPIEKHQEYTVAQLENLHGLKFDGVILETQFQTAEEIHTFLKQMNNPLVFFMFRCKQWKEWDYYLRTKQWTAFSEMLAQHKLRVTRHHRGTWLCLPLPPDPKQPTPAPASQ